MKNAKHRLEQFECCEYHHERRVFQNQEFEEIATSLERESHKHNICIESKNQRYYQESVQQNIISCREKISFEREIRLR